MMKQRDNAGLGYYGDAGVDVGCLLGIALHMEDSAVTARVAEKMNASRLWVAMDESGSSAPTVCVIVRSGR